MSIERAITEKMKERAIDRGQFSVVPFRYCRELALMFGLSYKEAELLALRRGLCPSRYERSIGTFGLEGQAKLLESSAAVIGCGGLGGWIIEILARAGVGRIVMVDGDVFDDNNLNRQLFASESNLGRSKAYAAAERTEQINAAVTAVPYKIFIDEENGMEILRGCGAVVDGLDNNLGRRAVFTLCCKLSVPFVHGAIGGFYGQVSVFRGGDSPMWESDDVPDKGLETETGNPPFTPPFIASVQAAETLKILAGLGGAAEKELLWFDLQRNDLQKIKL